MNESARACQQGSRFLFWLAEARGVVLDITGTEPRASVCSDHAALSLTNVFSASSPTCTANSELILVFVSLSCTGNCQQSFFWCVFLVEFTPRCHKMAPNPWIKRKVVIGVKEVC